MNCKKLAPGDYQMWPYRITRNATSGLWDVFWIGDETLVPQLLDRFYYLRQAKQFAADEINLTLALTASRS